MRTLLGGARWGCLVTTEHTPQVSPAMTDEALIIRGAREHNLKNVDVTIPRDRSRSTRSTPKDSAGTSSRSPHTRGNSSG
jgi:hypothetical protein